MLGTWGSDRETRRPGLWAGVRNRAEVNGARVKWKGQKDMRDKCAVSRASGATVSSSSFSSLQGRGRCEEGGGGGEPGRSGRHSAGGGQGQTLEPPGLRGRTGGQADRRSSALEDARGRAWSARKYAKGRGHGGGRRLPFSPERREGIYLGKGKRGVVTQWGWAKDRPDVMGREVCSRRDGWGLETEVRVTQTWGHGRDAFTVP